MFGEKPIIHVFFCKYFPIHIDVPYEIKSIYLFNNKIYLSPNLYYQKYLLNEIKIILTYDVKQAVIQITPIIQEISPK